MLIKYCTYKTCQSLMGPKSFPTMNQSSSLSQVHWSSDSFFMFICLSYPLKTSRRNAAGYFSPAHKANETKHIAILLNVSGFKNLFSLRSKVRILTSLTAAFARIFAAQTATYAWNSSPLYV